MFVGCCLWSCDELAGGTIVVGWLSGNENAFFFNQVPNYSSKWKNISNSWLRTGDEKVISISDIAILKLAKITSSGFY